MARISTKDVLDRFRFIIEIDGFKRMGFTSCETPSVSINTQSYAEGGAHLTPRKIIDSVEYKPITLQRGVTSDANFHSWAMQYMELVKGLRVKLDGEDMKIEESEEPGRENATRVSSYRREVRILHLDRAGRTIKTYILYNAFPIEYKPASDFDASADDGLSMEKLVLTYESFAVINTNAAEPSLFDPSDIMKRIIKRF